MYISPNYFRFFHRPLAKASLQMRLRKRLPPAHQLIMPALVYGALALGGAADAASIKPVKLGSAGTYAILSETGITDVAASKVVGDVGTSPITGAADLLTCTEVKGAIFSTDADGPAPCSTI